ncbi:MULTISPECIES: twin-arginine translocase subunit TatC [Thalassolituus]|jgi:sec-independent protein translocase protein TatC|uniref:twin-arginine translocase subunit TatC n=1 Tax=Thalassolituus TaxID=187492 RepID=UPI000C62F7D3|nr:MULTISPECIES: twin-arginine translocase subunit TatC [Thalassolituus]MAG42948.1 twin-arginine translocase subunit TatC [Oceanospirillaceae bacterium]MEC8908584.1 twin-arginine translocase subunit TatC [Pseudomonadota bacterium]HCG77673.1 twin-arginine translocase subunit TatC [Oceanospirillales bacterium]MAX86243.1 twin-arginine translocase subunit TatC [Oceanospirillaceae bacterium]MEC9256575.1 twin-arginine translocase subunit TatC [Pseudomonadota bacterium]|tara:strand:+ start:3610 stop:4350 length:741 start_codon:yes stop_codon:yes gene_type:complete
MTDQEQPLIAHLVELRNRLLRAVLLVLVIFAGLFYFANDLYLILVEPLSVLMPVEGQMIATGVASPFLVPFKLTFVLAVLAAVPFILHQIWAFISPGLYQHEKKFAIPLLLSSILLFYAGIAFAYFVVLPLVFGFFTGIGPEGISFMPDISNILDFSLKIFFAFGIAFEIPVATFLMVLSGMTTVESLSGKRPYIFLGCFVVGMLVTPPDVISQTILALPMYLLFEAGVLASRLIRTQETEASEAD